MKWIKYSIIRKHITFKALKTNNLIERAPVPSCYSFSTEKLSFF